MADLNRPKSNNRTYECDLNNPTNHLYITNSDIKVSAGIKCKLAQHSKCCELANTIDIKWPLSPPPPPTTTRTSQMWFSPHKMASEKWRLSQCPPMVTSVIEISEPVLGLLLESNAPFALVHWWLTEKVYFIKLKFRWQVKMVSVQSKVNGLPHKFRFQYGAVVSILCAPNLHVIMQLKLTHCNLRFSLCYLLWILLYSLIVWWHVHPYSYVKQANHKQSIHY